VTSSTRMPMQAYAPTLEADHQPWMDDAVCAAEKTDLWFSDHPGDQLAARRACRRCPVQLACLEYALDREQTIRAWGIWGGLDAEERRQLLRRRPVRSAA
jgi:WhiB family redox-sensing transcriptional regulator